MQVQFRPYENSDAMIFGMCFDLTLAMMFDSITGIVQLVICLF